MAKSITINKENFKSVYRKIVQRNISDKELRNRLSQLGKQCTPTRVKDFSDVDREMVVELKDIYRILLKEYPESIVYSSEYYELMSKTKKLAKGGSIDFDAKEFTISDLKKKVKELFPDAFGISLFYPDKTKSISDISRDLKEGHYGIDEKSLNGKFYFPQYSVDHSINFKITQGDENTYFDFIIQKESGDLLIAHFGFKDYEVGPEAISDFIQFLLNSYGAPKGTKFEYGGKTYYAKGGNVDLDAQIKAKRPGYRIPGSNKVPSKAEIKSGQAYYENRFNRSDDNRRTYPYLAKGGVIDVLDIRTTTNDDGIFEWLIIDEASARKIYNMDHEVFILYDDDSEALIESLDDIGGGKTYALAKSDLPSEFKLSGRKLKYEKGGKTEKSSIFTGEVGLPYNATIDGVEYIGINYPSAVELYEGMEVNLYLINEDEQVIDVEYKEDLNEDGIIVIKAEDINKLAKGGNVDLDAEIKAKRPGYRIPGTNKVPSKAEIKAGKAYYENRFNRSDDNRRTYPYLKKGGVINIEERKVVAGVDGDDQFEWLVLEYDDARKLFDLGIEVYEIFEINDTDEENVYGESLVINEDDFDESATYAVIPSDIEEMRGFELSENTIKYAKGGNVDLDAEIKAKRPGYRIPGTNKVPSKAEIKAGKAYYENRFNRSDDNRRTYPYLEKGGQVVTAKTLEGLDFSKIKFPKNNSVKRVFHHSINPKLKSLQNDRYTGYTENSYTYGPMGNHKQSSLMRFIDTSKLFLATEKQVWGLKSGADWDELLVLADKKGYDGVAYKVYGDNAYILFDNSNAMTPQTYVANLYNESKSKNQNDAFVNQVDSMLSASKKFERGGDISSSVAQIAYYTGLNAQAIREFAQKHNISSEGLDKIAKGLKKKEILFMDVTTAVVGKPDNKYQRQIVKYAKGTNNKMAMGGSVPGSLIKSNKHRND